MPRLSCGLAALALCLFASCRPAEPSIPAAALVTTPSAAPVPGLALRIASHEPCLACETLPQRDPAASPLYLKRRPVLTSTDIQAITRTTDSFSRMPAIEFTFRPDAHARIHNATSEHQGGLIAWVANGQAFSVSRLAAPFTGSMTVTGLEASERDELFTLLTGVKTPPVSTP